MDEGVVLKHLGDNTAECRSVAMDSVVSKAGLSGWVAGYVCLHARHPYLAAYNGVSVHVVH